MEIRPEVQRAIEYIASRLLNAIIVVLAVFVLAFVLCYLVSLACRCANIWPAYHRAAFVAEISIYALLVVGIANAVMIGVTTYVASAELFLVFAALYWAIYTMPRTVRDYRRERAE